MYRQQPGGARRAPEAPRAATMAQAASAHLRWFAQWTARCDALTRVPLGRSGVLLPPEVPICEPSWVAHSMRSRGGTTTPPSRKLRRDRVFWTTSILVSPPSRSGTKPPDPGGLPRARRARDQDAVTSLLLQLQLTKRMSEQEPEKTPAWRRRCSAVFDRQLGRPPGLCDDMFQARHGGVAHGWPPAARSRRAHPRGGRDGGRASAGRGGAISVAAEGSVIGWWDRSQIERMTFHLIKNAITFGEGKPISIRCARRARGRGSSCATRGMGIAREDQERIFARFERAVPVERFGGLGPACTSRTSRRRARRRDPRRERARLRRGGHRRSPARPRRPQRGGRRGALLSPISLAPGA